MFLPEIYRRARIKSQICLEWEVVQKAVSLELFALLRLVYCNIDFLRFRAGRTSVSSSNRTHVPYFRYFGPTAIVPGFKQMVRI
jgi:hypothetical protein